LAVIPTISAQNITPPPGTAGGVLLGKTGISNIQIKTPLTQQLNPADFGKEGAAIASGAANILNTFLLPRLKKEKANQEYQEFANTSAFIIDEQTAHAADVRANRIPGDLVKAILTKQSGWLKKIENSVSNPRYRAALKMSLAQQMSTMTLNAANLSLSRSNANAEESFLENSYKFSERFKLPFRTGEVNVFPNWTLALVELQTHENALSNTGMQATKQRELIDQGRLRIFNEIVAQLRIDDPKLGLQFMRSEQIRELLYGTSTGQVALEKAVRDFETLQWTQIERENKLAEMEEDRGKDEANAIVDEIYSTLYANISQGDDQSLNLLWLEKTMKPLFAEADRLEDYKILYNYAKAYSPQVGVTSPETYYKIKRNIFLEEQSTSGIFSENFLTGEHKIALSELMLKRSTGSGKWLQDNPMYALGKDLVEKIVKVPPDKQAPGTRQAAAMALQKWMDMEAEAIRQGPTSKYVKGLDFVQFAKDLVQKYGRLHRSYTNEHTQDHFKYMHESLPQPLKKFAFETQAGGTYLYDFLRMRALVHSMAREGTLKGPELLDTVRTIKEFERTITPDVLKTELAKLIDTEEKRAKAPTWILKERQPDQPIELPARPPSAQYQEYVDTKAQSSFKAPFGKSVGRKEYLDQDEMDQYMVQQEKYLEKSPLMQQIENIIAPHEQGELFIDEEEVFQPDEFALTSRSESLIEEPEIAQNIVTDPKTGTTYDLAQLDLPMRKKIANAVIDLAEFKTTKNRGKYVSRSRDYGLIAHVLWSEIKDEFKKNPSEEILKALFDKYQLPYRRVK
jgi:hypothetical protein